MRLTNDRGECGSTQSTIGAGTLGGRLSADQEGSLGTLVCTTDLLLTKLTAEEVD
jgi:hypothetical protein